ncbi:hypothetical protein APHAL10511_007951 [Amanita phalloides]|nr:hypothetical protein APHAL10511_007951 [Amanita phalloides]
MSEAENYQHLERRILWKLDRRILPPIIIILLLSFLDRANVGNAEIAGLGKELHLHGTDFNAALAVYFIPYILSEVPSNAVMKRFKPNLWLALLVATWGLVTTLTGLVRTHFLSSIQYASYYQVKNYAGFIALRLALGLCEGGLLPGLVLYLSMMYKRHELQSRIGVFYAAVSLSGAFGGLLATAILKMDGISGLSGWRWIFILEGIATVISGFVTGILLPTDMASARFLTDEERKYAMWRLKQDSVLPNADSALSHSFPGPSNTATNENVVMEAEPGQDNFVKGRQRAIVETNSISSVVTINDEEQFEWGEFWRGFFDIQAWLSGVGFFGLLVSLYSFSFFLPTLVMGLGYSGIEAQIHTVPPYIPAVVLTVAVAIISDRLKLRGPAVLLIVPLTIIGYITAIAAKTPTGRYVGSFLIAAGIYPMVPCMLALVSNNSSGHCKRAAATAVQITLGNMGHVCLYSRSSTEIYPGTQHITCICHFWVDHGRSQRCILFVGE